MDVGCCSDAHHRAIMSWLTWVFSLLFDHLCGFAGFYLVCFWVHTQICCVSFRGRCTFEWQMLHHDCGIAIMMPLLQWWLWMLQERHWGCLAYRSAICFKLHRLQLSLCWGGLCNPPPCCYWDWKKMAGMYRDSGWVSTSLQSLHKDLRQQVVLCCCEWSTSPLHSRPVNMCECGYSSAEVMWQVKTLYKREKMGSWGTGERDKERKREDEWGTFFLLQIIQNSLIFPHGLRESSRAGAAWRRGVHSFWCQGSFLIKGLWMDSQQEAFSLEKKCLNIERNTRQILYMLIQIDLLREYQLFII